MSFFKQTPNNESNQTDITTLADNLENCIKSGSNFRANCPICGSSSSRPFVLFENGGYFCHACDEKGGFFKLIKDIFNLDFSKFKDVFNRFNPFNKNKKETTKNFKYEQKKFYNSIPNNRERIFKLIYELIPKNTKDLELNKLNKFVGYDDENDTLAISLIDEKDNIVNIKRRLVGGIKWKGLYGGDGKFTPKRLTGKEFVFIASGMAEFMILHASNLDYIVMQSDGMDINHLIPKGVTAVILEDNDKKDIVNEEDKVYQCFKNLNQFNPFKKKVTAKITGEKIAIDFEKILNKEVEEKYDLRDFVKDKPQDWLKLIEKEIENQINQQEKSLETEEKFTENKKQKVVSVILNGEIVISYLGKFPKFNNITDGVVISRQHSGKTHLYEGVAGTLIIVPKVRQCNMFKGDKTAAVLAKIFKDGAIITFHKFYGHYISNPEFKKLIDRATCKLPKI